jgi:hypothetical protein
MCSRMRHCALGLVAGLALAASLLALVAPGRCAEPHRASSEPPGGDTTGGARTVQRPRTSPTAKVPEKWDPARAREEYRLLEFELALAKTGQLYLVFDVGRRELQLKVRGTVVWSCPVEIASGDSGDLERFVKRFKGPDDQLARLVTSKYLFAGAERTPDSILAIVGQVVKADPHSLQRDVPERFQVSWGWNLVLEVRTDIVGQPASKFRNTRLAVLESIRRPFGETRLVTRMTPEQALTLYRAADPGLPTAVYALP